MNSRLIDKWWGQRPDDNLSIDQPSYWLDVIGYHCHGVATYTYRDESLSWLFHNESRMAQMEAKRRGMKW